MGILRAVVKPTADLVPLGSNTDLAHRRRIGSKPIGDDAARSPVFHDPLEKFERRSLVPSRRVVTTASKTSPSWSTARHR